MKTTDNLPYNNYLLAEPIQSATAWTVSMNLTSNNKPFPKFHGRYLTFFRLLNTSLTNSSDDRDLYQEISFDLSSAACWALIDLSSANKIVEKSSDPNRTDDLLV